MNDRIHYIRKGRLACRPAIVDPKLPDMLEIDEFRKLVPKPWSLCKQCLFHFRFDEERKAKKEALKICIYQYGGCTGEATKTFHKGSKKVRCCDSCFDIRTQKEKEIHSVPRTSKVFFGTGMSYV